MNKYAMQVTLVVLAVMLSACSPANQYDADEPLEIEAQEYENMGKTVPKPVFQQGDMVNEPYDDGSPDAQAFVNFFNATYHVNIPLLSKNDVVWFPPQMAGDTSLELVARVTQGQEINCADPDAYPILCQNSFSTGEFCKACHDSVLFVEGSGLPQMAYFSDPDLTSQHQTWIANWSQYGDWSSNIMRLATRDPIWQAQIESETAQHPYTDPHVIQDVCFSCHGEMGERQLKLDFGPEQKFCTDIFYATIPGILSGNEMGKAFPFDESCQPLPGKSIKEHQSLYAKYGALARDGVSCETCHRIGPEFGSGDWDGRDYTAFYGPVDTYNVAERQTDNPVPLPYEFTATFDYDMDHIMVPDPLEILDATPMRDFDNLEIATAINEKNGATYLGQSVLCGSCHVLIVPQIPTAYKPDTPIPTDKDKYPFYDKPAACQGIFAPATRGMYGNPVLDDCVALGYEQATYLEWINSDFASEEDNDNTCQGCHMPVVTNPDNPDDHTAIMAQSTKGLTAKFYRRHRLMGINLPVFEMFMQFPDVLGVSMYDDLVPPAGVSVNDDFAKYIQNNLLNGQMAIVEQATSQANGNGLKPNSVEKNNIAATQITIDDASLNNGILQANLTIVNNTGHKFPSGAGFRRAFLRFEVLDAQQNVLWVSGQTNPYGAICDGKCVANDNGTYNLLNSEMGSKDPENLQPHYATISKQNQVQIYEVQSVDDTGSLTSLTLSLFHDAKDNRLLPNGFVGPQQLGCLANPRAGTTIFGIKQCSAAYATEPQLHPLTKGSVIADDPHYTDSAYAGSDQIRYAIPIADIPGDPASVRVTMEYQTIPPAYLATRYKQGRVEGDNPKSALLPATERSAYLTSHLNLNLNLKSEHPDNLDLTFSQNWTTSIYQASRQL